jgi:hypothetical protein
VTYTIEDGEGTRALAIAITLALVAALAASMEQGFSFFLGIFVVPIGLYAALAVRHWSLVVAAIASAVTGVAVIGYWIYSFLTFPWAS